MFELFFSNYELLSLIFLHFKSHFIFYFLLSINFFLVRFFKYNFDTNNSFLRNFKEIELSRFFFDPLKKSTKIFKRTDILKK